MALIRKEVLADADIEYGTKELTVRLKANGTTPGLSYVKINTTSASKPWVDFIFHNNAPGVRALADKMRTIEAENYPNNGLKITDNGRGEFRVRVTQEQGYLDVLDALEDPELHVKKDVLSVLVRHFPAAWRPDFERPGVSAAI